MPKTATPPANLEPLFFSTRQVAQLLGVNSETIRLWVRNKKNGIPEPVQLNEKYLRFRTVEIRRWLKDLGRGTANAS